MGLPELEILMCGNNEHIIAKVKQYKMLLNLNLENEEVKHCMIQWPRNIKK